jgi:hypothetical protein
VHARDGQAWKGWVHAVNTALDETGATIGSLVIALARYLVWFHRSLSELNATSASITWMTQNRTITLGSGQPFFSKW